MQSLGAGLLAPTQGALPAFELLRPTTLAQAQSMLMDHPGVTLSGGGTDLVAAVREGLVPKTLMSLRRLEELRAVEHVDGILHVGAMSTHAAGSANPVVTAVLPALADAWSAIATVRIRMRATIGGNLMARRFRYEMPVILGALDTFMEFTTASGLHSCTVDEFVREEPSALSGALLHRLSVDTSSLVAFRYDRSMRPLTTIALAIRRTTDGLRITAVVGSEYRRAVLLRMNVENTDVDAIDPPAAAFELAAQLPEWIGDYAGSAPYRQRVVQVLLRRELEAIVNKESTHD